MTPRSGSLDEQHDYAQRKDEACDAHGVSFAPWAVSVNQLFGVSPNGSRPLKRLRSAWSADGKSQVAAFNRPGPPPP